MWWRLRALRELTLVGFAGRISSSEYMFSGASGGSILPSTFDWASTDVVKPGKKSTARIRSLILTFIFLTYANRGVTCAFMGLPISDWLMDAKPSKQAPSALRTDGNVGSSLT